MALKRRPSFDPKAFLAKVGEGRSIATYHNARARDRTRSARICHQRDRCGYALFDDDIKIKDKRLFVRNFEARAFLKGALDELTGPVKSLRADSPIVVQRRDKSLVILRICPVEGAARSPEQRRELVFRELFHRAEDIDADAIIRVDYQNDGAIRIDETRVKLKRVVATGIAVKLSCAA
jgi:hypothetical protein